MEALFQDKAETKLASLEARSEEQRRARAQAEAEWRQQQRERELKRAQAEIAREKEASTPQAAQVFMQLLCTFMILQS